MTDDLDDESGETAEAESAAPLPRENPDLIGQGRAEAALLDCYRAGRLPHAWLLTGPRGIGKATLAFRFARFLLAQSGEGQGLFGAPPTSLAIDPAHPAFRRVASGGHADLLLIERAYDQKRKRRRSEILVDDVRQIAHFLHLTPAEGGWRIVIVDGADEMNRNAANALLKVLEEPSRRALLLITSASSGRLLPTIRSRCRLLSLDPLAPEQVTDLLRKYQPTLTVDEVTGLVALAEGSIGRALDLAAAGGLELYREMMALLTALPALDGGAVDRLADRLGRAGAEDSFRLMAELLPSRIARMIRHAGGNAPDPDLARLAARRPLDRWVEVWEKLSRLFALVDVVNLDRKQAMLNAFFALEEASR
ncbi:MAG TPA: DNA polymerase III subunit delta' [Stellaceae bacterium]|nr:DNA polymerase III subunit delta' [Stellaceae bacterium]